MNKTKKFIAYSLILFLWIILLEAISFTTLYVIQNKYNSLYFDYSKINIKPDLSNPNYSKKLGWISPKENLDKFGARIDDDNYKSSCIDMFGDSFTFSLDVGNNEAWPKKLGVLLKYPSLKIIDSGILTGDVKLAQMYELIVNSIEQIYEGDKVHMAKDTDKKELDDFVNNLSGEQMKNIQKFFETMPRLEQKIKVTNSKTKVESEVTLKGLADFFG